MNPYLLLLTTESLTTYLQIKLTAQMNTRTQRIQSEPATMQATTEDNICFS